jgi:hypothetical protein
VPVSVTISGTVTDAFAGVGLASMKFAVDDEYDEIEPSGPVVVNPDGTYFFVVRLAPIRQPKDTDGRLYAVRLEARDRLGHVGTATVNVTVPKG